MPHWILNRRADSHKDFCEDAYYYSERDGFVIAAVFDGCSDGVKSHFASELHAKLFRKIVDEEWTEACQGLNQGKYSQDAILEGVVTMLMMEVHAMRDVMKITILECLSTAVIALYNTKTEKLLVKFLGDGVICVNDEIDRVLSPDNTPDYIAYYEIEGLDAYTDLYRHYTTKAYTGVKSFSVCTDGVDAMVGGHECLEEKIHFLLKDNSLTMSEAMLRRKTNMLRSKGVSFQDDITIIRYEAV